METTAVYVPVIEQASLDLFPWPLRKVLRRSGLMLLVKASHESSPKLRAKIYTQPLNGKSFKVTLPRNKGTGRGMMETLFANNRQTCYLPVQTLSLVFWTRFWNLLYFSMKSFFLYQHKWFMWRIIKHLVEYTELYSYSLPLSVSQLCGPFPQFLEQCYTIEV